MSLFNAASRYTRIAAGQTASSIAGGESIRVHGIIVTAASSGTVTILDSAGTTIVTLNCLGNNSLELKTGFLADKGVKVTTDANTVCTVFHTSGAA